MRAGSVSGVPQKLIHLAALSGCCEGPCRVLAITWVQDYGLFLLIFQLLPISFLSALSSVLDKVAQVGSSLLSGANLIEIQGFQ